MLEHIQLSNRALGAIERMWRTLNKGGRTLNVKHGKTALNERAWHHRKIDKAVNNKEDREANDRRAPTTWWDPTNMIESEGGMGHPQRSIDEGDLEEYALRIGV